MLDFRKMTAGALAKSAFLGLERIGQGTVPALLLLALAAPPLAGYGLGTALSGVREPSEGDFDIVRKQRVLEELRRSEEKALQRTRQLLGLPD